jgi:ubiquinone/menaquinone biosynthesis C-methylase UbiE
LSVEREAHRRTRQEEVDAHFADRVKEWRDTYTGSDLGSLIRQQRLEKVESFVNRLPQSSGARALDVGCGTGKLASHLARAGWEVYAVDTVPGMLALARADSNDSQQRPFLSLGDVCALPFTTETFELVVAVGLIAWVPSPLDAMYEMARVLKPGGTLIVTCGNSMRLVALADPLQSPFLAGIKNVARSLAPRRKGAAQQWHHPNHLDAILQATGLRRMDGVTVGFGPFKFCGRLLLPDSTGIKLHRWLQGLTLSWLRNQLDADVPR